MSTSPTDPADTYADRIDRYTPAEAAEAMREATEMRVTYYTENPHLIPRRLDELDAEWDLERVLGTTSSGLSLLGVLFGFTRSRVWWLLPMVVQGFYLQHQLSGYCPPLPWARKLGFRTREEIESERHRLEDAYTSGGDTRGERRVAGETSVEGGSSRILLPEHVGRTSDALPQTSDSYIE